MFAFVSDGCPIRGGLSIFGGDRWTHVLLLFLLFLLFLLLLLFLIFLPLLSGDHRLKRYRGGENRFNTISMRNNNISKQCEMGGLAEL